MQLEILTIKTLPGLYCAWSPDRAVLSYGNCAEEALNNLQDELRKEDRKDGEHVE